MTTPSEPSKLSVIQPKDTSRPAGEKSQGVGEISEQESAPFGPPTPTNLASLTDGRTVGEFASRYPVSAWVQIGAELFYLVGLLSVSTILLALLAKHTVLQEKVGFIASMIGAHPSSAPIVIWAAV